MRKKRVFLVIVILLFVITAFFLIKGAIDRRNITSESKLSVIYSFRELKPLKKYLIYIGDNDAMSLLSHFTKIQDLDANGNVLYALERVRQVMKNGGELISVYNDQESVDDAEKKNVNILYFSSLIEDSGKPFVIVVAGGGYQAVCSLLEAYPVARQFNELGYPVFVLNYRINNENGLFPKPMEDVAQALNYIYMHYEEFDLSESKEYIIGGFSAGGHISAEWGTENEGYLKYNMPSPKAIFLGYPAISSKYFVSEDVETMTEFRENIVGENFTDEMEDRFSADMHVHSEYPPTYIVYCADDDMVDPKHSRMMVAALDQAGVLNVVEEGAYGGHGFATGLNTSVEGWIERAVQFFESL